MKVLVTGGSGFLGSALQRVSATQDYGADWHFVSSADADLTSKAECESLFNKYKPHRVIHLAAMQGGIGLNRAQPADLFHINSMINGNVFFESNRQGVEQLVYVFGGCSYPALAKSPIAEDTLFEGMPQIESRAYSLTKALGFIALDAYQRQYGLNSLTFVPGNMYGPNDDFSEGNSHVIGALVRKFTIARDNAESSVEIWGSGAPLRDFVYVDDVASVIVEAMFRRDLLGGPINVSSGTEISIKQLANMIKDLVGYRGELCFDTTKPDGQMRKQFDVTAMKSHGFTCETNLKRGLEETINWFESNKGRM